MCVSECYSFLRLNNTPLYVCATLYWQTFGAIVNSVSVNIHMQVFVETSVSCSFGYIRRSRFVES